MAIFFTIFLNHFHFSFLSLGYASLSHEMRERGDPTRPSMGVRGTRHILCFPYGEFFRDPSGSSTLPPNSNHDKIINGSHLFWWASFWNDSDLGEVAAVMYG